jgi:hypothetical protein
MNALIRGVIAGVAGTSVTTVGLSTAKSNMPISPLTLVG